MMRVSPPAERSTKEVKEEPMTYMYCSLHPLSARVVRVDHHDLRLAAGRTALLYEEIIGLGANCLEVTEM